MKENPVFKRSVINLYNETFMILPWLPSQLSSTPVLVFCGVSSGAAIPAVIAVNIKVDIMYLNVVLD